MTGTWPRSLTSLDVRLLERLSVEPNVVRAARTLGIGRDRAVYRLARLARIFGRPVATGRRGGPSPGQTRLTPLGRRLLRESSGTRPGTNRFAGVYRSRPSPHVELGDGAALEVAFPAAEGRAVALEVDPEAFVIAREKADLSARNRLDVVVERVRARADGTAVLTGRWGSRTVRATLTVGSVERLGLAAGRRAFLYVKAVAVRRRPSPGSLRS